VSDSRITQVTGTALVLRGDDVDTDRIIPARYLKAITFEGLDAHVFADERRHAAERGEVHPFDAPAARGARMLLVNSNFGCGSSREHAPQALWRRGIGAVVGESFGEIFLGNSTSIGLPCVTASKSDIETLMARADASPGTPFTLDLATLRVQAGDISVPVSIPTAVQQALISGAWDMAGQLLEDYDEVERVGARLPYTRW
jgi:3-isopropylmalate/(R)-2-methylmalate dehydratase small subunit